MKGEDSSANFAEVLISVLKISYTVRDKFFLDKFRNKIKLLVVSYIKFSCVGTEDGVAQYQLSKDRIRHQIDEILELIQYMKYIKILDASLLVLYAQKNLLSLKLEIVRRSGVKQAVKPAVQNRDNIVDDRPKDSIQAKLRIRKSVKLNESKKKILEYIRSYPESRTKDIIHEFSTFSDRTVKRNLTELLQGGLLKRRIDNKAVYYSVAD